MLRLVAAGFAAALVANAPAPAAAQAATEVWAGAIETPQGSLRLELHVTTAESGAMTAELVSLDQGNARIAVDSIVIGDGSMTFAIEAIAGNYRGTLNEAGDVADGTWTQLQAALPLRLTKREAE